MIVNKEKNLQAQQQNEQLRKSSKEPQIKLYFTKVFELQQSGEEFPVNMDDVWPLIYQQKVKALETLKNEFIEGEEFYLSQKGKVVKINELQNGVKIDAFMTSGAMEYLIARKVKPVFDVYRKVFHKAMSNG